MQWPASRAVDGQGARVANAIAARISIALANRAARNVNGSASAAAYFATMKPLDHSSAKVSGVARMKAVVSRAEGMAGLSTPPCLARVFRTRLNQGGLRICKRHAASIHGRQRRVLAF